MKRAITDCLTYFLQFAYAPTFDEIHTFLKTKTTRKNLLLEIGNLRKKGKLNAFKLNKSGQVRYCLSKTIFRSGKYTLGEYSIRRLKIKNKISKIKIQKAEKYIKILSWFPLIRLVGLSGSVAMLNARDSDDIDLFIITAHNRIWTARLTALLLSQLLGIRRKYGDKKTKDKICLNLFFDEYDLAVPQSKHSEYVGHEVLQMKPVIVKDDMYMRFLDANRWVYDIFPNTKSKIKNQKSKLQIKSQNFVFKVTRYTLHIIGSLLESLVAFIQLRSINRHQTTELITDTQLWFHPDDYEQKIKAVRNK